MGGSEEERCEVLGISADDCCEVVGKRTGKEEDCCEELGELEDD